MKKIALILLGVVLLSAPWLGVTSLSLLVAFVPLLWIQHKNQGQRVMPYVVVTFLLWNACTTFWVSYSTLLGGVAAILINTLLTSSVFWIYNYLWKRAKRALAYTILVTAWIGYEYIYLNGEISWPWLTLGYGFAGDIKLVQWYEFLGSLGGSLWVLVCNLVIFKAIEKSEAACKARTIHPKEGSIWLKWVMPALFVLVPVGVSLCMYYSYVEVQNPIKVSVIQPNIDPYNEKFGGLSAQQQEQIILSLAAEAPRGVDYFVAPETALDSDFWVEGLSQNPAIVEVRQFLERSQPQAEFIVGITALQYYPKESAGGKKPTLTARESKGEGFFYDVYNSAVQIDTTPATPLYHKSKLVIGVEKLPYPQYLGFLGDYSVDLGGITGSLGTQARRTAFVSTDARQSRVGTAICYESVYGGYFTGYVQEGAQVLFIITNDGWWKNSPGCRQHFSFARLRAVETRRSIARSANTGISGFINQRGDVLESIPWDVKAQRTREINLNDTITFYVMYGDMVGRVSCYSFIICMLYYVAFRRRSKDHLYQSNKLD